MRFYYPSIFSLIFIAVLYVVALGAIWFVWTRIYKRKFSGSAAWSIVALVLVAPWLEEFWIAWNFGQLCRKDAGIVINKTVEVEGFYDDTSGWGARQLVASGYKKMESKNVRDRSLFRVEPADERSRDEALMWYAESHLGKKPSPDNYISHVLSDKERVVVSPNKIDAWRINKIDKPTARYHYKTLNSHTSVSHQITRFENVVEDTQTGEILGRYVNYYRGAYWFFIHLSRPTIPCSETEAAVMRHGTLSIHALTLKPIK